MLTQVAFCGICHLHGLLILGSAELLKNYSGGGDFNPNEPDNCGRTPLLYAANHGHKVALKTRGGREDPDPDKPEGCGKIPLSDAAIPEHEELVKLLVLFLVNHRRPPDSNSNHSAV